MKERLQVIDFKYTVATITFFFDMENLLFYGKKDSMYIAVVNTMALYMLD